MQTNIDLQGVLREKAQAVLNAMHEFWVEHQKQSGPRAVVWLQDSNGRLLVHTRGEYCDAIMSVVGPLAEETPLT
jgi:hypothetical protein